MRKGRRERLRLKAAGAAEAPQVAHLVADAPVELKAADGSGSGSKQPTFTINAYGGGTMRPYSPWLCAPLVIDLEGAKAVDGAVALLDHDPSQIVGQATKVTISSAGIVFEGKVTGDVADKDDPAAKVVTHAKNGFVWKASLDATIGSLEKVEAGESVRVNGRTFDGPVYIARRTMIDGVSFVSIPADKSTSAAIAASEKGQNMEFHAWLKARGFDPATLTDVQRDHLQKQWEAERLAAKAAPAESEKKPGEKNGAQPAADLDVTLAAARAKKGRRDAINAECARLVELHPDKLDQIEAAARTAISEDWTADRFTLWAYRELPSNMTVDNRPRSNGRAQADPLVVEAAVARSMGLENIEKQYAGPTLEASERFYRSGVGLEELLVIAAAANGVHGVSRRNPDALLRAAFGGQEHGLRATGPSTFDVSGILGNVGNKAIREQFEAVDNAWSMIAATRPVNDFKTITSYALSGDFQYQEVAPSGELKHGTIAETSYTNQAKTYGRMFALNRTDIINDDLGAFKALTRRLGRGGALKLNDVFWTAFLNNSAFFASGNSNYASGTDTAFGIDSLAAAEVLFMNQVDPDGKPVGIMPAILLVPSALYRPALQVLNSSGLVIAGTTDRKLGSSNTFQGNFKPVTSPYMSNSTYTGYSAAKWYLLADPNDMPVIEVAFLNGVQRPTVEQAQADFNQLGIQFRGYFDFGVTKQEYRGGVAMAGS